MKHTSEKTNWRHWLGMAIAILMPLSLPFACSRHLSECDGPGLNTTQLAGLRRNVFSAGSSGYLVLPNPIEATNNVQAQSADALTNSSGGLYSLPQLLNPNRLESDYLKVRIRDISDDLSTLAKPDANGSYKFQVSDVHYSEVMTYFSINAIINYTEALGFKVHDSRQFYVMVRDKSGDGSQNVNAYYLHNYLDASQPRTMRLIGDTKFPAAVEEDIPLHETGHNRNELLSAEVGMDYAGDNGATYTQAASLHECLADYYSETFRNKGYVGKWIARNFSDFQAGQPLRSAVDTSADTLSYREVAEFDGTSKNLDRYRMAEWCTRALWQLRDQFVQEDPQNGAYLADRMILSALSFVKKDTNLREFRAALQTSDQGLHCGLHAASINQVFELRGYAKDVADISSPMQISGTAVGFDAKGKPAAIARGGQVAFTMKIANISGQTARNVRVYLESGSALLQKTTYMQGFGDVPAGAVVNITGDGSGLDYSFSVSANIDQNAPAGSQIPYRLHVMVENGTDSVYNGVIQL